MKLMLSAAFALLQVGPVLAAQRALHANDGDGYYKEHGHTLAPAGDVNADGVQDYWMGAPDLFDSWPNGSVYLVSGRNGDTLRQLDGLDASERFGFALAGGRDLSGDGVPDVLVGAPRAGLGQRGAVRAFSGADGRLLRVIPGRAALERFGEAVTFLDDLDGDAIAELAIGAPGDDRAASDAGSVRIHSGASGVLLATHFGTSVSEELGAVLANAGDLDGDGKAELLLGVPRGELGVTNSGKAMLVSGASGLVLRALAGDAGGDQFGRAVAGCPDLDGDGVRELLVGAPGGRYVRVFSGASGAVLWSAARSHPEQGPFAYQMLPEPAPFGWAMCALGDQNRDGYADVAVGYPESSSVWVLSGADGTTLALHTAAALGWNSESHYAYLGFALAPLGDLDRDGFEDLVVGAPTFSFYVGGSQSNFTGRALTIAGGMRRDHAVADVGAPIGTAVAAAGDVDGDGRGDVAWTRRTASGPGVVVTSGRDGGVLRSWTGAPGSGFGRALAPAGDVDADGVTDLLVGAHTEAANGAFSGRARVFSGATGAVLHTFTGATNDFLGLSVAGLGDCNGDGHADVAVGAPRVYGDPVLTGFCTNQTPPLPGYVRVHSGADGALLFEVHGEAPSTPYCPFSSDVHAGEAFGFALAGVGDWNGDGVPDLAVGAPGAGELWGGAVRVFSGVDGSPLAEFVGQGVQSEFGVSLAGAPDFDVDADGFVDLLVGEEEIYYGGVAGGEVHVFSSASGLRIAGAGAQSPQQYGGPIGAGYAVAVAGDFDGDGHSDFVFADPTAASLLGPAAGAVYVVSGANGAILSSITGTSSWDYLGYSVAAAGDVNGDGRLDVVVGAPTGASSGQGPNSQARIRVIAPHVPSESSPPPRPAASPSAVVVTPR
jgi:hypothetical protein